MNDIKSRIEAAFERRAEITPGNADPGLRQDVDAAIALLDSGQAPGPTLDFAFGALRIGDVAAVLSPGENFAETGLTPTYLRETKRGMAAVEQRLRYIRELHAGDVVHVTTRLYEAALRKIRFEHRMYDDLSRELVATSELTGVHLDTVARRAVAFEDDVRSRLQARLAADATAS